MHTLLIAFLTSVLATFLVVRYRHIHEDVSGDHDVTSIQKFHSSVVPRVGGVCIFLGVLIAVSVRWLQNQEIGSFGLLLILSAIPAFGIGLIEDITKTASIAIRLGATVVSALLSGYLLNAWLGTLGIDTLDQWLIQYPLLVVSLTCFAVAGVANAFNIIDGYNGLSGVVAVIVLGAIALLHLASGITP